MPRSSFRSLALACALASCSDATAPVVITPTLHSLGTPRVNFPLERGFLEVGAGLDVSAPSVRPYERVRVRVETSAGDLEWLYLERTFCGQWFLCNSVSVSMREGHTLFEVVPLVPLHFARWDGATADFRHGVLRPVRNEETDLLIARLRLHSGTQEVMRTSIGFLACEECVPDIGRSISDLLPSSDGAVRREDGIVQLAIGDTVVVTYSQPDGSTLTTSLVVAEPCCPA